MHNVRIYRPSKNTMQSGRALLGHWVLEYELETARRPDPLMGWISSGDTDNQVQLQFPTEESAIEFARKKGWITDVEAEHDRIVEPRNYATYYTWQAPKKKAADKE
jgi:hypothetical protein